MLFCDGLPWTRPFLPMTTLFPRPLCASHPSAPRLTFHPLTFSTLSTLVCSVSPPPLPVGPSSLLTRLIRTCMASVSLIYPSSLSTRKLRFLLFGFPSLVPVFPFFFSGRGYGFPLCVFLPIPSFFFFFSSVYELVRVLVSLSCTDLWQWNDIISCHCSTNNIYDGVVHGE